MIKLIQLEHWKSDNAIVIHEKKQHQAKEKKEAEKAAEQLVCTPILCYVWLSQTKNLLTQFQYLNMKIVKPQSYYMLDAFFPFFIKHCLFL